MNEQSLTPSPVIERLLTGLGARAEVTDAVLGDLHQKLTEIAGTDGVRVARRWYRREALRATPHLLLDGVRSLRFADARRLVNIGLLSATMTLMLAALAFFGGTAVMKAFTGGLSAPEFPARIEVGAYAAAIVLVTPVLAGFLAATLEEKAPLLAAMTIAAGWGTWTLFIAARRAWFPVSVQLDFIFPAAGVLVWITMGCAIGGLLRVGQGRQANATD